jgi:hypothetical protein
MDGPAELQRGPAEGEVERTTAHELATDLGQGVTLPLDPIVSAPLLRHRPPPVLV